MSEEFDCCEFRVGNLVVRSDHWRRERSSADDFQLGIVTEVEFFNEDGKAIGYPVIHWEGAAMAAITHPDNAQLTTWKEVQQRAPA